VYDRHAQDAHIEFERHPHVIGDKREVMDPTQHWFTAATEIWGERGRNATAVIPMVFLPRSLNMLDTTLA